HRGVIACAPDSPLAVVAATMASHEIHAAAVLSADGDRALAVRDLDVIRASLSGEEAPTALEIACETMPAIPPAAPLADALALMAREDVSHLIVTEPGGNWPTGVISSFDLVAVLAGRSPAAARVV